MGLDFDAVEYCKNIKQRQPQPPYACPVDKCDRSYKTIVGLQYHLVNYDHDNPQPLPPMITPHRKKARSRGAHHATPKGNKSGEADSAANKANSKQQVLNPESLVSYNDADATVQFNIDGKSVRIGIDDALPFIDDKEFSELIMRGLILNPDAPPLEENAAWTRCVVPQANFCEIPDYHVPDAPARPLAYYRFIEKSAEELDGEIEYDVDEEDTAWLDWMNEQREQNSLNAVNIDTMELLMDRLEKESFFQAAANGTSTAAEVDDDAVCCICMDGECQNTNVILFCDMCNLAVHQDCYGVPYIPEGQWLCRRCLQSPSTPVSCVLCPNAGGAFKQTDRGQWAHVVCALWIPEVRFANTVFLEPIDSIETIPAARWRLTCYVCKEKGLGACIQCHRNSCYAAFHVTCAQQAGLYMTMDTINDGHNDSSIHVQKFAYCHAHTPPDAKLKTNQKEVEDTRHKMKEARKALAKKRSSAPVVLIPTIPADRVQEIATMVHMQKKSQFLDRLIAYWTLKRQCRNGVPLLRRLQSQGNHHGVIHRNGIEGAPDTAELYRQLKYWQCLRQDLERARLLCELVRKREKLKAQYVKIYEQVIKLKLNPLDLALTKLLDALETRDTSDIFSEPVDTQEVPDYSDIVKHPMDLGTMREKLRCGEYSTLEQLEADFDLMIQNCLAYNNKDTVFYRAGIRMRDQAAPLFVSLRRELQREGLLQLNQQQQRDHVEAEVECELKQLLAAPASEEIVQKLLILADKSQVLKDPVYRTKKIKQIRMEITRMRKQLQKDKLQARNSSLRLSHSLSDDEHEIALAYNKRSKYTDDATATTSTLTTATTTSSTITSNSILTSSTGTTTTNNNTTSSSTTSKKQPMRRRLTVCGLPSEFNNASVERRDFSIAELAAQAASEAQMHMPLNTRTPPCSPLKGLNSSASPVGVNRRTAVLFTRKAQNALKRPTDAFGGSLLTTPVKEEQKLNSNATTTAATSNMDSQLLNNVATTTTTTNYNNNNNNNTNNNNNNNTNSNNIKNPTSLINNSNSLLLTTHPLTTNSSSLAATTSSAKTNNKPTTANNNNLNAVEKSGKRRHKRNNNNNNNNMTTSTTTVDMRQSGSSCASSSPMKMAGNMAGNYNRIPDSFRVYRANNERDVSESDDGDMSDVSGSSCSSCSGFSMSGSATDYDSSHANEDDDDDENRQDNGGQNNKDDDDDNDNDNRKDDDEDDDDDDDNMAQRGSDDEEQTHNNNNNNINSVDLSNGGGGDSDAEVSSDDGDSSASSSDDDQVLAKRARQQREQLVNGCHRKLSNRSPTPSQKPNDWVRAVKKHKASRHTGSSRPATPPHSQKHRKSSKKDRSCSNGREHKHQSRSGHHKSSKHNNHHHHHHHQMSAGGEEKKGSQLLKPPLEPLQLVWAKCRGYPWYPALILDPKTPKGFVYNGVPLPAPPPDVLALRKNYTDDHLFLVLFFDAKRTWQWLPANKLEILGIDKELDQQKLVESRKPTERKAVKKAYQDALHYQSQVSDLEGQGPDPIM